MIFLPATTSDKIAMVGRSIFKCFLILSMLVGYVRKGSLYARQIPMMHMNTIGSMLFSGIILVEIPIFIAVKSNLFPSTVFSNIKTVKAIQYQQRTMYLFFLALFLIFSFLINPLLFHPHCSRNRTRTF